MKSIIIFHTPYGYGHNSVILVDVLKKSISDEFKKEFYIFIIEDNSEYSIRTEVFFNPNMKEQENITNTTKISMILDKGNQFTLNKKEK